MVLLDNVDTAVGHDFLDELVMARRQRAAHADDDPDPLTVVATSRSDLAERVRLRGESAVTLTGAGYADYLARSQTHIGRWWYPVLLPDLTLDEVGNMVSGGLELPAAGTRRAVSMSGTGDHRRRSCRMASRSCSTPSTPDQDDGPTCWQMSAPCPDPRVVGAEEAERRGTPAEPDSPGACAPEAVADLATCGAARSEEAALRSAAESGLLTGMRGEDSVIFAAELWRTGAPGRAAQMHPMLRRLLLRRLAKRDPGAAADWNSVFHWLRTRCQDARDETGELYHALALGAIEHVSRWFAHALEGRDPVEWMGLLDSVTAAPNRLDYRQGPATQVRALTQWAEQRELPLSLIGRLVAASWIYADPLSAGHRRSLLREMSADLHQIATYAKDGLTVLRDQADAYRDAAADGGSYD